MKEMNDELNCDDFLLGQKDCVNGVPHKSGNSDSYERGYSAQYAHEQNVASLEGVGDEYL